MPVLPLFLGGFKIIYIILWLIGNVVGVRWVGVWSSIGCWDAQGFLEFEPIVKNIIV